MNLTPFLRTPFTDLFGPLNNFQSHRSCAPHELRTIECLEAYGVIQGREKCSALLEDFRECVVKGKQNGRMEIMAMERKRQWEAGERKERYANDPPADSY